MSINIRITLPSGLYLRDPQDSELGRKYIEHSILLINDMGFEAFTFKKLAQRVDSTEASIYRYFKNKHLLLLYLVSWYWEWVRFLIKYNSMNVVAPRRKLGIIIHSFVAASKENHMTDYVNENLLHQIVISEGLKAYFTKKVDNENTKGLFISYKLLSREVAEVVQEINPEFKYSHTLATNLFEMSNHQMFFARHLPLLTDIGKNKNISIEEDVEQMLNWYVDKLLQ